MHPFSDTLQTALKQLYQLVSPDIPDTYSPSEIAEAVIDGQKLQIYGFHNEQMELTEHNHNMNYDDLLSHIVQVLGL